MGPVDGGGSERRLVLAGISSESERRKAVESDRKTTGTDVSCPNSRIFGIGSRTVAHLAIKPLVECDRRGVWPLGRRGGRGIACRHGGVQPNDVINRYGDQKLFSTEQLVRLVHGDKPGQEVALGIIRGGKPQTLKVTLGEQQVLTAARPRRAFRRPLVEGPPRPVTSEESEASWALFDSMTLSQVDENHFKAQIQYRDDKGKVDTRNFEGTRDEIRTAIALRKIYPRQSATICSERLTCRRRLWSLICRRSTLISRIAHVG